MSLDVNVDIYPLKARQQSSARARALISCTHGTALERLQANDKFAFALSRTLAEDGTPDDGTFDQV